MENEKLKDYFTRYPQSDEVYENNGVLFHTRGAADSYGSANETVRYTRNQVMASQPMAPEVEQEKATAIELLKTTDVATLDYKAMKQLVKDLELNASDQKAETLKGILTEFKNSLNEA